MLRHLWKLSEDRAIAGVTLVLRDEPASSYAHAEEMADAIRVLRARGKKVICSWEDAGPKALYVCASANRVGALLLPYLVLDEHRSPDEALQMAHDVGLRSDVLARTAFDHIRGQQNGRPTR